MLFLKFCGNFLKCRFHINREVENESQLKYGFEGVLFCNIIFFQFIIQR